MLKYTKSNIKKMKNEKIVILKSDKKMKFEKKKTTIYKI